MNRMIAMAVLIAAFGILIKLTLKFGSSADRTSVAAAPSADIATRTGGVDAILDLKSSLSAKYAASPPSVRELIARVVDRFGQNAQAIERTDGLQGLVLLDRLDIEAIFLYEKHSTEFRRLRGFIGEDSAADILLHWREYFGWKRADDTDRGILIAEITNLAQAQQRLVAGHPSVLPLILAEPAEMSRFMQGWTGDEKALGDVLAVLCFVSLEPGPSDLRTAIQTFDHHGPLALEAFRRHGLDGFALVSLYGSILEAMGNALPLDQSLIVLRVNADYIDELLRTHRPETIAGHLRHIAATGLIAGAGGSPNALRLVVEYGTAGERALRKAGPDGADVVFGDFIDAGLRRQAVNALAMHGAMGLAMLDKYATDPDFCEVLRMYGAAVIPPIAQSDAGPETVAYLSGKSQRSLTESLALAAIFASGDHGQATIRTIKNDGLERVAQLDQSEIRFYQFLPLYDVIHLGNVMRGGYAPTSGEMTWALVDASFVIADVLSLAALQPEGAIAAEAVRSQVKATVREGARSVGRELIESGTESASKALARRETTSSLERAGAAGSVNLSRRMARWWAVRQAGGLYQVMRQIPEALPRLSLGQISEMAGPLAAKAGLRMSTWKPVRLLKDGAEVVLKIPPQRGVKYLSAQAVQAGVGVIGFQKMEEHLAFKRQQIRSR